MFLEEIQKRPLQFIFLFLIFIFTSQLSTSVLVVLDLLFVRIVAIALLLWAITSGPVLGVVTFLVLANLFLERNRRKLSSVKIRLYSELASNMAAAEGADGLGRDGMQKGPERPATLEEEGVSQKNVFVPPFEEPELGNVWRWTPEDSCKEENWSAVAPTINTKQPVRTITGGSKTWPLFITKNLAGPGIRPSESTPI